MRGSRADLPPVSLSPLSVDVSARGDLRHAYLLAGLASVAITWSNPPWWISATLLVAVVLVVTSARRVPAPTTLTPDPNRPRGPRRPPAARIIRLSDRPFDWRELEDAA